jgi:hypothetical protein
MSETLPSRYLTVYRPISSIASLMHWEAVEILTLVSGAITAGGFLILPDAELSTRLKGAAVGVFSMLYAVWAASQTSGIIVIPVGSFAAAGLTLFMLFAHFFGEQAG